MAKDAREFQNVPELAKYYAQRYRLWSNLDDGIWMTERGWEAASLEHIASEVADQALSTARQAAAVRSPIANEQLVAVDAFCGCGCNTVQLAKRFSHVFAVDLDESALEAARHNCDVCHVADKVTFLKRDFFNNSNEPRLQADFCFASPPWGGGEYIFRPYYDVNTMMGGFTAAQLFQQCRQVAPVFSVYLPRNVLAHQVVHAWASVSGSKAGEVSCTRHMVNGKCKGTTWWFTSNAVNENCNEAQEE